MAAVTLSDGADSDALAPRPSAAWGLGRREDRRRASSWGMGPCRGASGGGLLGVQPSPRTQSQSPASGLWQGPGSGHSGQPGVTCHRVTLTAAVAGLAWLLQVRVWPWLPPGQGSSHPPPPGTWHPAVLTGWPQAGRGEGPLVLVCGLGPDLGSASHHPAWGGHSGWGSPWEGPIGPTLCSHPLGFLMDEGPRVLLGPLSLRPPGRALVRGRGGFGRRFPPAFAARVEPPWPGRASILLPGSCLTLWPEAGVPERQSLAPGWTVLPARDWCSGSVGRAGSSPTRLTDGHVAAAAEPTLAGD